MPWPPPRRPTRHAGDPETAPGTIYALAAPDIYLLLVDDRGWTPDSCQTWLAAQLIRGLLR